MIIIEESYSGFQAKPMLRYGSVGNFVTLLQQYLNNFGYNVTVDGKFGRETYYAVRMFQREQGLRVDGIVGPKTWERLEYGKKRICPHKAFRPLTKTLRIGSKGPEVEALQNALRIFGYCVAVDGKFGRETETAVKLLQKRYGLVPDGIVGPKTRKVLNAVKKVTKKKSFWEWILSKIFPKRKVVIYRVPEKVPPKKVPPEEVPPEEEEKLPSKKPPIEELGVLRYLPYVTIGLGAILLIYALTSERGRKVIVETLPVERVPGVLPAERITRIPPTERIERIERI